MWMDFSNYISLLRSVFSLETILRTIIIKILSMILRKINLFIKKTKEYRIFVKNKVRFGNLFFGLFALVMGGCLLIFISLSSIFLYPILLAIWFAIPLGALFLIYWQVPKMQIDDL